MILNVLREGKTINVEMVNQIREKDPRFASLSDNTLTDIINIYKKDAADKEPTADKVAAWLAEFNDFADFLFINAEDLTTKTIADFVDNDDKLKKAVLQVLVDWKITDKNGVALDSTHEKFDTYKMCRILLDTLSEVAAGRAEEKIPQWAYQIYSYLNPSKGDDADPAFADTQEEVAAKYAAMTDEEKAEYERYAELIDKYNKTHKSSDLRKQTLATLEDTYHNLFESMVCPKCHKHPCVCEAVEGEWKELPTWEDVVEFGKDAYWDVARNNNSGKMYFDLYTKNGDVFVGKGEGEARVLALKSPDGSIHDEMTVHNSPAKLAEAMEDEPIETEVEAEEIVTEPESSDNPVIAVTTSEVPEVPQEIVESAFHQQLSTLVQKQWEFIDDLHSVLAMLDSEDGNSINNKEDVIKIVNGVIDTATIDVGMIYKAMELVSAKTTDLIADGIQKAEETIN